MSQGKPLQGSTSKEIRSKRIGIFIALGIICAFSLYFLHSSLKPGFIQIPILFFPDTQSAYVEMKIEDASYLLLVDSGGSEEFSLKKEILENISPKNFEGTVQWFDLHGRLYNVPTYRIPLLHIGKAEVTSATVREESLYFLYKGGQIQIPSQLVQRQSENRVSRATRAAGRIGAGFFRCLDYWLIDLPHGSITAIKNFEKFKKQSSFFQKEFVEAPLEPLKPHIAISVHIDSGVKKLILDTGSDLSILHTSSQEENRFLKTSKFKINGHDFGENEFYLFCLPDQFKFDGFIGQDFLKKHPVFLDFKKNKVLIGL